MGKDNRFRADDLETDDDDFFMSAEPGAKPASKIPRHALKKPKRHPQLRPKQQDPQIGM